MQKSNVVHTYDVAPPSHTPFHLSLSLCPSLLLLPSFLPCPSLPCPSLPLPEISLWNQDRKFNVEYVYELSVLIIMSEKYIHFHLNSSPE